MFKFHVSKGRYIFFSKKKKRKKKKEREKEVGAFREIDSFPNIVFSLYFLTLPSPSPLSLF